MPAAFRPELLPVLTAFFALGAPLLVVVCLCLLTPLHLQRLSGVRYPESMLDLSMHHSGKPLLSYGTSSTSSDPASGLAQKNLTSNQKSHLPHPVIHLAVLIGVACTCRGCHTKGLTARLQHLQLCLITAFFIVHGCRLLLGLLGLGGRISRSSL